MDLGAYSQIENLNQILLENDIVIPRLRGLRLMKNEKPLTPKDIEDLIQHDFLTECEMACESDFRYESCYHELSERTRKLKRKYLIYKGDNIYPFGIRWENVHGKKRKLFKYILKQTRKKVHRTFDTFNKYCGQDDILYIHARIGGANWIYYDGPEIAKQPWFIEKVDDYFDNTYCDIYARIKPIPIENQI